MEENLDLKLMDLPAPEGPLALRADLRFAASTAGDD